jgi:hypothetical protein
MKQTLISLTIVSLIAVVALIYQPGNLQGQNNSTNNPTKAGEIDYKNIQYPEEEYTQGLWNDGKAVFSDIKLLDILWRRPFARGYRPEQPIKFSHVIHVQKNQMECTYCHSGVAKSSFATIPSVELCMGCHKLVKTDSEEIKKLKKYYDEKKPVEWVPVNNLPEHAHFNHQRHVKAGVGCQNCHGQVQKQQVVERVSSLKMGFCLTCHREKGVSIDCATCHY